MITFNPIGVIHSPHKEREGAPIQSAAASEFEGKIEILPQYKEALNDLDGFERIILLYHFHLSDGYNLKVKPFLDNVKRGLFATRAPRRPNQIGISIVKLLKVEDNTIYIKGVDVVNGTPLIDIKPYVPIFDAFVNSKSGWFDNIDNNVAAVRADKRFVDEM
ncbi:MAG: tRNA (N6-threonylcarbamoyladenosine(37)-N6)-methyltransferase TrmO [Desulfamplus sp.]|nr:tRNA (N6-threonylcarbamoyladenosine(37)-N6)-methyltransferase TrmO [Desulfamplus sp.]